MSRIIAACVNPFLRLFMPGIAEALREENQRVLHNTPGSDGAQASDCIEIEDRGADVTIVSFAGMAVLYAAMPKFEFRKMLQAGAEQYNLVFVRDIYRSSYRLAPDGSDAGIAFYERAVSEALNRIGARTNLAVGMSGGGEAACRISGAAPIHGVIALNPAFPLERYGAWRTLLAVALDGRKLLSEPSAYLEVLFVVLGVRYLCRRNRKLLGPEDPERPLRDYLRRAAPTTLFYSRRCRPDAQQALALKDVPSIALMPLDSPRHNCLADLKADGGATALIQEAIQRHLRRIAAEDASSAGS